MSFVGLIDLVNLISFIIIFIILLHGWKNRFSNFPKTLLSILIIISIFHAFSNFLEWIEITDVLDVYEDFLQILEPILWFVFFAAFFQETLEKKRRVSEKKYRLISENANDLISILNHEYKYDFINEGPHLNTLGYTFDDLNAKPVWRIIHSEDINNIINNLKDKERFGETIIEFRVKHKNGGWIWLQSKGNIFKTENNEEKILLVSRDITKRKEAKLKLHESEEKLRKQNVFLNNILESLTHPFYVINVKDYTIALANSTASSEGLEHGQYCYSLTHNSNKPCEAPCICPLNEVIKTKKTCVIEHVHYDEMGNENIYEIYGYPILDESGNVVQMIEYALNISYRKEAEQKLITSEGKYRDLFESSPISLWEEDFSELKNYIETLKNSGIKDFRVYFDKNPKEVKKCGSMVKMVSVNKKTLELFKANKKEDFFAGLDKVFREESYDTFKELILNFIEGKAKFESETINYTFTGDKLYLFIVSEIPAGFKEDWSKVLTSILDISERKKIEQKLVDSEEKFRTIAERTNMGIILLQNNQVKYANDAIVNMFEYTQEDIVNWEIDDLIKIIHPEDLHLLEDYDESLRSGVLSIKPYNSYRALTKLGKVKWIDQFSKEIHYEGFSAELITIMDITEKKEAEQELIKLNNMKSELLRRTSHELKTPLVSIKGFSDLLLELHRNKLDDYVIRTLEQIRTGCNRLESLVNDILKTSELESGTVELKKLKEDLSLLIKMCVSELEGLSELRNHTINLDISDNLICSFEIKQIYNVITNILSNAIKFTPSNGKMKVKSEINNDFVIISIKDNGIGFTKEEKTQIFKQFGKIERYGQGYDVISEGSGLGLYISKKIIEMHGGEIWVESEGRDKGSTFYFSLPID